MIILIHAQNTPRKATKGKKWKIKIFSTILMIYFMTLTSTARRMCFLKGLSFSYHFLSSFPFPFSFSFFPQCFRQITSLLATYQNLSSLLYNKGVTLFQMNKKAFQTVEKLINDEGNEDIKIVIDTLLQGLNLCERKIKAFRFPLIYDFLLCFPSLSH